MSALAPLTTARKRKSASSDTSACVMAKVSPSSTPENSSESSAGGSSGNSSGSEDDVTQAAGKPSMSRLTISLPAVCVTGATNSTTTTTTHNNDLNNNNNHHQHKEGVINAALLNGEIFIGLWCLFLSITSSQFQGSRRLQRRTQTRVSAIFGKLPC